MKRIKKSKRKINENNVAKRLLSYKKKCYQNKDVDYMNLLQDFAFDNEITLEELGKLISNNELLTELINENFKRFGYIKGMKDTKN